MQLNEMLTTLNKLISTSSQHTFLFYRLLRKEVQFEWTSKCEKSFTQMKHTFLKPLFLLRPIIGETLLLYLEVSIDALSVLLLIEVSTNHNSIYFISKALTDSCTHCQKIDKISLGIMITLRKLCFYFLSHSCVGCTY